jgi:hypothetical protein
MSHGITISSTAGGAIANNYYSSDVQFTPYAQWASMAINFQTYRVLAMRLRLGRVLINGFSQGPIAITPTRADFVPTTFVQACEFDGVVFDQSGDSTKPLEITVNGNVNPTSKLWTETTIAIAPQSQFGISIQGQSFTTSSASYSGGVEASVEVRGST